MTSRYEIHPRIGVARLGNSPNEFYLSPETVGGQPIECDESGNPIVENGSVKFVDKFKDSIGRIKRQAAKFRIFEQTGDSTREVTLSDDDIDKIVWTVHIANKYLDKIKSILFSAIVRSSISDLSGLSRLAVG